METIKLSQMKRIKRNKELKCFKYYRGLHELEKFVIELMFKLPVTETNEQGKIRVDQIKQFFPSRTVVVVGEGGKGEGRLRTPTLILPRSILPVFFNVLFYSTFISLAIPRLLIVPLSAPRSHYRQFFLKNWVQNVFWLVFVSIRFPGGIANFVSLSVFPFRYVCWEVCTAANSCKIKLGAHCFRKFRFNLMYVNLTFGTFALILCNVNFLRVVNVHR